jgi:hypothetical protein
MLKLPDRVKIQNAVYVYAPLRIHQNQILINIFLVFFYSFNPSVKEEIMSKVVHQSQITITREKGPTRKAQIVGFNEPVYYGVHGGIKDFYNIDPEEEHAATLDHIVGAVGG